MSVEVFGCSGPAVPLGLGAGGGEEFMIGVLVALLDTLSKVMGALDVMQPDVLVVPMVTAMVVNSFLNESTLTPVIIPAKNAATTRSTIMPGARLVDVLTFFTCAIKSNTHF